jgi:hypothetical protein
MTSIVSRVIFIINLPWPTRIALPVQISTSTPVTHIKYDGLLMSDYRVFLGQEHELRSSESNHELPSPMTHLYNIPFFSVNDFWVESVAARPGSNHDQMLGIFILVVITVTFGDSRRGLTS